MANPKGKPPKKTGAAEGNTTAGPGAKRTVGKAAKKPAKKVVPKKTAAKKTSSKTAAPKAPSARKVKTSRAARR